MFKLLKNISIYSLGNILNKGVMFLLLPLYTRILQPADYGKLELVYLAASILSILYGLNVQTGYNRIYFQKKDTGFRKTLFGTGQLFNLACALLFASLIFLNANWIAERIFRFPEGPFYLKLILGVTILEVMTHIPFNNLRARQEAKKFVLFSLLKLITVTTLTIYFVAFAHKGVAGVLYGKLIGDAIVLSIFYFELRNEIRISFSADQLKMMLSFSVFLIPSALSALILNMSNRYFLQEYQTLEDVGLFSLGAKLAGIIPFLFTEPVKKAFGPYLFEQIDTPEICKKNLADFTRFFLASLAFVALFISLFSREVIMVMSDQSYSGSYTIVTVLSVSYWFLGLAGIIVTGIHITKKTWIVTIIWPVSAIINIVLNIWLIPQYSRMGAAWATLISVIFITLSYFYALQKVYPVKFDYLSFVKIFVILLAFNYAGSLVVLELVPSLLIKTLILVAFIVLVCFSGVFTKNELLRARQFIVYKFTSGSEGR